MSNWKYFSVHVRGLHSISTDRLVIIYKGVQYTITAANEEKLNINKIDNNEVGQDDKIAVFPGSANVILIK